jgi:hypothetical protein
LLARLAGEEGLWLKVGPTLGTPLVVLPLFLALDLLHLPAEPTGVGEKNSFPEFVPIRKKL